MAGVRTDNPNPLVGGAVHKDLYKLEDPAGEKAKLTSESRKLALGFLLIFFLLFGLIGFSVNGFWSKVPHATLDEEYWVADKGVDDPSLFQFVLSDGSRATVDHVDHRGKDTDDDRSHLSGPHAQVVLVVDREFVADLYAPAPSASARAVEVRFGEAYSMEALDGKRHAWNAARLFHIFPIRYFVVAGAVLGVLCLFPPFGRPFYQFWMKCVAHPMSWVNTRLILSIFFLLVFVPAGLWLWIRRTIWPVEGDPLSRAVRPTDQTYWSKRPTRKSMHFRRWF